MLAVTESKLRMQDRMTEASSKPSLTRAVFMVFSISVLFPYFTTAKFGFILPSGCRED
jgi:hypothetical protein